VKSTQPLIDVIDGNVVFVGEEPIQELWICSKKGTTTTSSTAAVEAAMRLGILYCSVLVATPTVTQDGLRSAVTPTKTSRSKG
jgi:hypothetical protein